MSFSPNLFLSNIKGKGGLARPCRYEVIIPIPAYIGQAIGNFQTQFSVMSRMPSTRHWVLKVRE